MSQSEYDLIGFTEEEWALKVPAFIDGVESAAMAGFKRCFQAPAQRRTTIEVLTWAEFDATPGDTERLPILKEFVVVYFLNKAAIEMLRDAGYPVRIAGRVGREQLPESVGTLVRLPYAPMGGTS